MATTLDALKSLSNIPIPQSVFDKIEVERDINLSDIYDFTISSSAKYKLCEADVLLWLSKAPEIVEGGVTIKISDTDKAKMEKQAVLIYNQFGDTTHLIEDQIDYGDKGDEIRQRMELFLIVQRRGVGSLTVTPSPF
jgi:hypothetical protein